jgi:hypothetical protein
MSKSIYNQIIDLGERAEHMADALLRDPNHKYQRIGVVCRDMSLTIAQVLSADVNKRLAELEHAA